MRRPPLILAGLAVAAVATGAWSLPAWAGAWPLEPGRGQAIISFLGDGGTARFDESGARVGGVDFRKLEASAYLEHGLTRRLTVVARPAYQQVRLRGGFGDFQEAEGVAATELGARVVALRGEGGVVSVQVGALIPGEGENLIDARLGDGAVGGEVRLLGGMSWGERRPVFVEAQIAARVFEGQDDPEGRLDLSAGMRLRPNWLALAQTFSTWSDGQGAIARRDYVSHKAQLSVVRDLTDSLSVQSGAFRTVAGRNVIDERAGFVALWLSY
ncbi:MAG: hypothetical protein MI723_18930 [Caulobacterales bacterium]|nr:hypothetical protein [Caulobacterales bacterium]